MAKTTFTATDEAGTSHIRTSENRTYTHTVVALPSYDFDMAQVDKDWTDDGANFDYYSQVAAGNDPHARQNYMAEYPDRWTAEEIKAGEARVAEENAQRIVDAKARTDGHSRKSYIAAQRAKRIAGINERKADGHYGKWRNLGWCGRRDLAGKLAATATGSRYAKVAILEAHVQAKKTKGA